MSASNENVSDEHWLITKLIIEYDYSWLCVIMLVTFFLFVIVSYKFKKSKYVLFFSKKIDGLAGNVILAFLGVFWASSVSLFSTEIKSQLFNKKNIGLEFFFFELSILLFLLISYHIRIFQDNEKSDQRRLPSFASVTENKFQCINMIKMLGNIILEYNNLSKSKPADFEKKLDKSIDIAIESILRVVNKLVEHDSGVKIKSNLFNLIKKDNLISYFNTNDLNNDSVFNRNSIIKSPFFIKNKINEIDVCKLLSGCDFVLVCNREFSKGNDLKDITLSNDELCPPLCMPVTFDFNDDTYHPNIFGAPEVVVGNKMIYISNLKDTVKEFIEDIKKSVGHSKFINQHYLDNINEYYQRDKDNPLSIISIPVHKVDDLFENLEYITGKHTEQECANMNEQSLGDVGVRQDKKNNQSKLNENKCAFVLNIYINRRDFFESTEQQQGFGNLIEPLVYTLSCLMTLKSLYSKKLQASGNMNNSLVDEESING